MLESISWTQYFTAAGAVAACYYAIAFLLLRSDVVKNIFVKNVSKGLTPSIASRQTDLPDLIGGVQPVNNLQSSEFEMAPKNVPLVVAPTSEPAEMPDDMVNVRSYYSAVDSVVEEVSALIDVLGDHSKDESIPLFKTLLARHEPLDNEQRDLVSITIYNLCKSRSRFAVELNEILTWWPQEQIQIIN